MRENYNSYAYWEETIRKNENNVAHVFMDKVPTEKSLYLHTLIFTKDKGIKSTWCYFPNVRSLIGYLQYSFLREAFYKWSFSKESEDFKIPSETLDKLIKIALKKKKIDKETARNMDDDFQILSSFWDMSSSKINIQLKKFAALFNKKWMGDNSQFLYIKYFTSAPELGDFVVSSSLMTNTEDELENKMGMAIDEWNDLCKNAVNDKVKGERFREILTKNLTEVL